jgi:hypothetical protein
MTLFYGQNNKLICWKQVFPMLLASFNTSNNMVVEGKDVVCWNQSISHAKQVPTPLWNHSTTT